MTMKILFNGSVLVKPGGATRVDASLFTSAGLSGVGVVGLVGEADGGQPGVVQIFTSPELMRKTFRSGALADAAALAFQPGNDPRVPGGASAVVCVKANSTAAQGTYTFQSAGSINAMVVTARDYGVHTNKITVQISDSSGGKVLQTVFQDGTKTSTETSAVVGSVPEFTIQYTGAGTACTLTTSSTQLTTTATGAAADSLTLSYASYPLLSDLIAAIQATGVYSVVAGGVAAFPVVGNPTPPASTSYAFNPMNLDYVTAVDVKTTATGVYAKLFRCIDWFNSNSVLVSAARAVTGVVAPTATARAIPLAGGLRGVSSNTDWQNGFNALGGQVVNEVVPLISADLTGQGFGSTATFASVVAMSDAHAAFYSSTAGKSERQNYVGMAGTKAALLAQAGILNSPHTLISNMKVTVLDSTNTLRQLDEWGFAVITAGMRAGSDQGEPLTWKYIRASDISNDASWTPLNDGSDLILGGVYYAEKIPNKGIRIGKCITTYTRQDNDAYTEESVVMGWKNVAYQLRTHLENLFIGRKVSITNLTSVRSQAEAKLSQLRAAGQIVDSVVSGTRIPAYRNLEVSAYLDQCTVSVVVSPVSGINFMLNNIFLVPAQISA
jgi:hypothetical protein